MTAPVPPDPWTALRRHTTARIALGRTGASLPTHEVLAFALAHAQARDAVHTAFQAGEVSEAIEALGLPTLPVESAAPDRATYLRRPDLGRRLSAASRDLLTARSHKPADLAIVVADGLSSTAVHAHAAPLIAALLPLVRAEGWSLAPVAVAHQARVALGDEVGQILGARLVLLLVGERPGLSSPDSLGAYLTFAPRVGLTDAARNCVSNIRGEGLSYPQAAAKLVWLAREALRLGESGVALKDESDTALLVAHPTLPSA
ncbi:ethanolamine ammonia-lyase subunit EutC [Caulobacter sp.]|uniref:ethanolamine ammonia-lyase subunit EutC n=1 Tax=Caulobacter sp. TaxID=78 RepID=UPI003BAB948D